MLSDFRTPEALWAAIDSRIAKRVAADPSLNKAVLQRQLCYERFLARIFSVEGDWVLKGGTALLVRARSARHSKDIDLFLRQGAVTEAVAELTELAATDLGDHFRFVAALHQVGEERPRSGGAQVATVRVDGYVGARRKFEFTVDTVVGSIITAEPEYLVPEPIVEIGGLTTPRFRLYPIVDHIADKLCATFELFGRRGGASTRVRDLVDLVVIARTQSVDALTLRNAIEAERSHRELQPITEYRTPAAWQSTYSRAARGVADCVEHQRYAEAVELIRRFLDPVLSGALTDGVWRPDRLAWDAEPFTRRRDVGGST
ncbi:MAG TPA: nucleotidyl transferase AbiEii/AbiGii toxin family protein [Pseudonocardiaceae bacterium]|nr:nucleotidyl transferase AbiEii/AbiGii toxin family protein [Pseudonocardiaceae bacterium]